MQRALKKTLEQVRENVANFTRSACDLSWKMVIQDPVMMLRTDGNLKAHNPDLQEVLMTAPRAGKQNSVSRQGEAALQYLEPALCQGESVLIKARVKEVAMKHGK